MNKQTRNQKGFSPVIMVFVLGIAVVTIALLLIFKKTGDQQITQTVPAIQSSSDLNTVASDLENTDMSQFDKELNQLDSDTSSF